MNDIKQQLDFLIKKMDVYIMNDGEKKNKVERIRKEIIELKEVSSNKVSLVFVAGKGKGKTTIINYILDLIYLREKNKKGNKKIKVYQDVLTTGSGATTTSEVEIIQSNDELNKIEIDPYTIEETIELIKEFCKIVYGDLNRDLNLTGYLPDEFERAVRNMTNLNKISLDENKKLDLAKELAKEYQNSYEGFESEVIKRANLELRKKTNFSCNSFEKKQSIRMIFRDINLMKIAEAPLPRKIRLKISNDLFDFADLGNVNSIIDTRGLEEDVISVDRKDIKSLFRYEKDKIIILVDEFKTPTKSLMGLIDNYVEDETSEIISRLIYMVNFKDGEPENVITDNGEIEDEVEGTEYKKSQLINYIKTNKINIDNRNIIYINPRRYLDKEGKINIEIDDLEDYGNINAALEAKKDIRILERNELIRSIKKIVKMRREYIINRINLKKECFLSIKNKQIEALNLEKKTIIDKINFFYLEEKNKNIRYLNSKDILANYILSNHPATLMALNNRFGIYNERDIFLVASNELEKMFKKPIVNFCNNTLKYILKQAEDEKGKKIIAYIIDDIKRYYFDYMDKLASKFYTLFRDDIYNEENCKFWNKVIIRWGRGPGYLKDVNLCYKEQLIKKEIDEFIVKTFKSEFYSFSRDLINLIEESI